MELKQKQDKIIIEINKKELAPAVEARELTLKEFFQEYPIKIEYIAERIGRTREWLSKKINGQLEINDKDLIRIINALKEIASEINSVEIIK